MSHSDSIGDDEGGRIRGVAVGIVTDNEDPKGIGRVKLRYPWRDADDESYWARVATEMAGEKYGTYFLPEIGDEVLVAFEDGNIHHPYVIGSLWSGQDKPPETNKDGSNNLREIKSRSGHTIDLNDSDTEGRVEIETSAGHKIVLDDTKGSEKITIEDTGGNSVEMDATKGEVTISGSQKISLSAPTVEVSGDVQVKISSNGKLDISGMSQTNVSSKGQLNIDSNGIMNLNATGPLTIKGAIIQLN